MNKFTWDHIHSIALRANTPDKFHKFCVWMRQLSEISPCGVCRDHMKEYISQNPPESAKNAFYWTWQFHNAVNSKLGKPTLSYEDALNLYSQ